MERPVNAILTRSELAAVVKVPRPNRLLKVCESDCLYDCFQRMANVSYGFVDCSTVDAVSSKNPNC